MTARRVRPPLVALGAGSPRPAEATVGRAGLLLWRLAHVGLAVPESVAVPASTLDRVAADDGLAATLLAGALERWLVPGGRYVIEPSSTGRAAGEHGEARPAGTATAVAEDVAESLAWLAGRMHGGSRSPAADPASSSVAAIVQREVDARATGVSFSRDPQTGLGETVIEISPVHAGDGALEPGPAERWVRRWGAFSVRPEAEGCVPDEDVVRVADETARLEHVLGGPVELCWAWDGRRVWWLSARLMGGLEGLRLYSNRIAREVLPGVIKPLVWSVNVPIVNAAWIELLEELVGPLQVRPEDLARSFGYRAYFDMTTLGDVFEALGMSRETLELLLGLPRGPQSPTFRPGPAAGRHLPRLAAFLRRALRRGRWTRREVVELRAAFDRMAATSPTDLDAAGLVERVDQLALLTRRAAYANIVVPLLMLVYARLLSRLVSASGLDPALVDPALERPDRRSWDPAVELGALAGIVSRLPPGERAVLEADPVASLETGRDAASHPELAELRTALAGFLRRFGHLSDSGNDFSVAPWREDPGHVLRMALSRATASSETGRQHLDLEQVEAVTPSVRRPLLRLAWRRAGAFRVYREAVSSTYGRGYGLFRETFLSLGERLVEVGRLDAREDVFYLTLDEVRGQVAAGSRVDDVRPLVSARRAEVSAAEDLIVPDLVVGDLFLPRRRDEVVRSSLSGIPTSRGVARGEARIVRGAEDFERVRTGDIIVIPWSDVGWTPLFGRAAAVVAEAGGMLSHSSIVAREHGIPCVVSVDHACSVIPDGALLVVDGVTGSVLVEDAPPAAEARRPGRHPQRGRSASMA